MGELAVLLRPAAQPERLRRDRFSPSTGPPAIARRAELPFQRLARLPSLEPRKSAGHDAPPRHIYKWRRANGCALVDVERTPVPREQNAPPESPSQLPSEDAQLVRQLRQGDPEAGARFVREQYPPLYRYLLYLTNRPEVAEDLTR